MTDASTSTAAAIQPAEPDLHCPLCDYNLRGLIEPRCPECGYMADSWEVLRNRATTIHRFLFEHHPEHNVRSLFRTLLASLWPWWFWHSVRPHHPVHLARLVLYWFVAATLSLSAVVGLYIVVSIDIYLSAPAFALASYPYGSASHLLDFYAMFQVFEALAPLLFLTAFAAAWPWVVSLVMRIFSGSLAVAKIKHDHIRRCAIYSADVIVCAALLLGAATAWLVVYVLTGTGRGPRSLDLSDPFLGAAAFAIPVLFLLFTIRLAVAFRVYLRLRHAITTAILVQIVIALATLALIFHLGEMLSRG